MDRKFLNQIAALVVCPSTKPKLNDFMRRLTHSFCYAVFRSIQSSSLQDCSCFAAHMGDYSWQIFLENQVRSRCWSISEHLSGDWVQDYIICLMFSVSYLCNGTCIWKALENFVFVFFSLLCIACVTWSYGRIARSAGKVALKGDKILTLGRIEYYRKAMNQHC
jgi:hypothetical protein